MPPAQHFQYLYYLKLLGIQLEFSNTPGPQFFSYFWAKQFIKVIFIVSYILRCPQSLKNKVCFFFYTKDALHDVFRFYGHNSLGDSIWFHSVHKATDGTFGICTVFKYEYHLQRLTSLCNVFLLWSNRKGTSHSSVLMWTYCSTQSQEPILSSSLSGSVFSEPRLSWWPRG